jgi:hypothetical protein
MPILRASASRTTPGGHRRALRAHRTHAETKERTMSNVVELDKKLNEMLLSGKAMEAFEEFYGDDVSMQENSDTPCVGKEANRKRELEFFGAIEKFHGMKLLSSAVQGDVSFSETESDLQMKGMPRFTMSQVSVRRWKNGKIASERFYYSKG